MSSRILGRAESSSVKAMIWAHAQPFAPECEVVAAAPAHEGSKPAELIEQIAHLHTRLEAECAAAYQRGFRDGEAKAKSTVVAEMQAVLQRMSQAVSDLADLRPRLRREAESDVVQLSVAIARRVLCREMSVDPSAMQALVHCALKRLARQEICRVYVHPNQASAIQTALSAAGTTVDVIPEITRPQGTLIFETNQGTLDASVNAQLDEIDRGLTDRVKQL